MSNVLKVYLQPAFLVCTAVLAVAASGMSVAIKSFGVHLKKEPLPLKKPLDLLDEHENGLAHYKVVAKEKIENEEIVKSLGTSHYIQWQLEDSDASADSPVRYCSLFITYYELPDIILHVPEECYMGGGYQRLSSDSITLEIDRGQDKTEQILARYLVFGGADSGHWMSGRKFPVLYLFNTNGVYTHRREDTRVVLNKNLFGKHSYFCKVEWKFFNKKFGTTVYPDKKDTIEASQKFLSVILPVLEKEHWPMNNSD